MRLGNIKSLTNLLYELIIINMKNLFKKNKPTKPQIDEKTLLEFNTELSVLLNKYDFTLSIEKVPESSRLVVLPNKK